MVTNSEEDLPRIYLSPPHMSGREQSMVEEAITGNWVAPAGPHLGLFEQELSAYLGCGEAVALSSGTAGIHLALIMLGVKAGDEVLVSSFTFAGTVNPVVYQQAVPVFVDSEPHTWNMDPVLLEEAIKSRMARGKKPKAIVLVHLYGMPARMEELLAIAQHYDIPVIEDAAEALGSRYKDVPCGTFGCMRVLSFNGNKIITTSGGGALLADAPHYTQLARKLSTQAREDTPHYEHTMIGYNYRMSNVLAGIGRAQLSVLEERVKQCRANNRFYRQLLENYSVISFQDEPPGHYSNYWLTTILVNHQGTDKQPRERLRKALERSNVESRPLWKPMHMQPVFRDAPAIVNGTSQMLFETGLCLPSGTNLSEKDKDRIAKVIKDFMA